MRHVRWVMALTMILALSGYGINRVQAGSSAASGPNPQMALAALLKGRVYSTGPHGETATSPSEIRLTAAQIQTVRSMHATAAIAYKAAAARGVKLVFMDNVPKGMKAGKDYVSVVSADNCGNGIASAYLM